MEDTFLTLKHDSEAIFKEKGSKFLAFAYPVADEHEIKMKLESLRKKYFDARHHCYGYMLGKEQELFRANDDGEPNHSAGDPILGQIRSHQLTNVLIVVVRYFGGTKLGVGGLIQAYKTAASEAILDNEIITAIVKKSLILKFDYIAMNDVMKMIKDYDLEILDQNFDNVCRIHLCVREGLFSEMTAKIESLEQVKILNG